MEFNLNLIPVVITFIIGLLLGGLLKKGKHKALLNTAKQHADQILKKAKLDAESIKKEKQNQSNKYFRSHFGLSLFGPRLHHWGMRQR